MNFFKKKQDKIKNNFDDFPPIGGLMVSKMVVDQNIKPRFMYREKRTKPEDSGWRIFTGMETEEYTADPDNAGIYNASTILKIDSSIENILLKGVGSVYEKTEENPDWYKVTDFELEDDYMKTDKLTENWTIEINNLFERTVERDGDLLYTTGDKSVRLAIWDQENKNKEIIYAEHKEIVEKRNQSVAKTLQKFDFSDDYIARVGYLIKEEDGKKIYNVIHGFSIIENQVIQIALYFDEDKEINWATETWMSIINKI